MATITSLTPLPVRESAQPIDPLASTRTDCTKAKCVALTFDDGPGPHTPAILKALRTKGAKATFFVTGRNAARHPATVRTLAAAGMAVGNHSWNHPQYTRLNASQQRSETARAARAIKAAGAPNPTPFRPPYGAHNTTTRRLGFPIIAWNVDPRDWQSRDAATTKRRILSTTRRGSIVLLHDIVPSTAKALPGVIKALQARGYTLVTVPEMLGRTKPGAVYSHGPTG